MFREFARLDMGEDHLPDESTILRFRHLLEAHDLSLQILATVNATLTAKGLLLKQGTVVDATLIAAPSSTKNSTGTRDPEMHQTKKGNQWHHGMKAHIGSDADLGLVHSVTTTAANAHDITQAHALLHGQETDVFADSGYRGVEKREEIQAKHPDVKWHIAMMPGKRKAMDKSTPMGSHPGAVGKDQSQHPRQGGTPVSRHQEAVRLRQGQVPGAGQKHGQSDDAVCAVQPVDGAQTTLEYGRAGMSAPKNGQGAATGAQFAPNLPFERKKVSSSAITAASRRVSGGCADLP
jgi:IS5 family transposase